MLQAAVSAAGPPWRDVDVFRDVDSTNAEAARRLRAWRVVCADHQSHGRGRLARRWEAPAAASIAVSVVLPAGGSEPSMQGWLPLLTGMAMAQAVHDLTGQKAGLKWPNDLMLHQARAGRREWRKVGGVLCEISPAGDAAGRLVVAGVGLNVDQSAAELPVATATSLALSGAGPVSREELIAGYLARLARLHEEWSDGGEPLDTLRVRYREQCLSLGQQVRLHRSDTTVDVGRACAVDDTGRLVLDTAAGRVAHSAGDVVHLRPAPVEPATP